MFPSKRRRHVGTFVLSRCIYISKICELRFVSPRFFFPVTLQTDWLYMYRDIESKEIVEGIETYYPIVPAFPFYFNMLMQTLAIALFFILPLARIRKDYNFDLIHAQGIIPSGFAAVVLGMIFKKPVVLTACGADINDFPKIPHLRWFILYALNKANGIVAVSNALKNKVIELGINPDKVRFIPSVVKQNFLQHQSFKEVDRIRKKILFVGQIIPRKGIQDLVKTMAIISKDSIDTEVDVVGNGFYYDKIRKLIEEEGIQNRFNFMGSLPHSEIPELMAKSDILCLPSYREGWPNVCIEALSVGLPVVATDIGGTNEIITDEDVGILVKAGDYNALASALKYALDKKWDRNRIREYAKRFSGDDMAYRYNEAYTEAIKRYDICN